MVILSYDEQLKRLRVFNSGEHNNEAGVVRREYNGFTHKCLNGHMKKEVVHFRVAQVIGLVLTRKKIRSGRYLAL